VGAQIVALQLDFPCKNCYAKHCSHHSCMRQLTPDQVLPYLPEVKRPHA
jgi:heptosyltransferase II